MEEKENAKMNIHVHTFVEMVNKAGKYISIRIQRNIAQQKFREKKKALQEAQNTRVLRPLPRQNHYDMIVSHELEEISKLSIADRKIAVQSKFRTIKLCGGKRGEV